MIPGARDVLFVIDGANPSSAGAAAAKAVVGPDVRWTAVSVIADHPRLTTGATGFAAPVLSPEEMETTASADLVAGNAAAAATATGFGNQPVKQSVVRGELGGAIARYVDEHHTDLVVVDSAELVEPLMKNGIAAVLVVAPHADGAALDSEGPNEPVRRTSG